MPKRKRLPTSDLGCDMVRHLPPRLKGLWREKAYERQRGTVMDDSLLGAYLDGFLCGRLGFSRDWNPFDEFRARRLWRMGWDYSRGLAKDDRALEVALGECVRAWELEEYGVGREMRDAE